MLPRRVPIKLAGRGGAKDELRRRCFERVREGREQLLSKLREMASEDDGGMSCESVQGELRSVARGVLRAEARWGREGATGCAAEWQEEEELDPDELLALEEEIL